jgi:1-acyl-sn-glycerol-3-phosphate acyltransferase
MQERVRACAAVGITLGMSEAGVLALLADRSGETTRRIAKKWGHAMVSNLGIDLHVEGVDDALFRGPMIVMANHNSHLDIPILYAALPRALGMLAKADLFKFPIFGRAMTGIGCIPIERESRREAHAAVVRAAEQLRQGQGIVVFPEGTRGDGRSIQSFKAGAFHLALAAGVPVVPVGVRGTAAVCPRDNFRVVPGPVQVRVGTPIDPKSLTEGGGSKAAQRARLARRVRDAIVALSGLPPAEELSS